jgi:hypothetical protein
MDMGGGGGGGGVIYNSSYAVTQGTAVTVTVGNGGTGAPAAGTNGQSGGHQYNISATQGGNSVFGSITSIGGGYGGSSYFQYGPNNGYGGNGGSGGGASGYSDGNTGRNGTGSSGQGFNGGTSSGPYYSGGGGGAGGAGSSGPNIPNGGPGVLYSTISPYYFGGGGGGSAYSVSPGGNGGIGGGGGGAVGITTGGAGLNNGSPGGGGSPNAQTNTPGGDAGANTGGGGGGGSHYNSNNKGGNGGSGIVIVRYSGPQKATGGTITTVAGYTIHTFTSSGTFTPTSIWYDTTPNGNNGTVVNNPTFSAANGGSLIFNGSNNVVNATTSIINKVNGQEITVACWIKPSRTSGQYSMFCTNRSNDTATYSWMFYQHASDGAIAFHGVAQNKSSYIPAINQWINVVNTVTAGGVSTLYINGASNFTVSGFTYGNATPSRLGIGADPGGQEPFQGSIAQVLIFNKALTASEVLQNYNSTKSRFGL